MHKFLAIACALLLASCQTIPDPVGFSSKQVETLVTEGFVQNEQNYELGLSSKVLFGFDQSGLKQETSTELARLAKVLVDVGIGGATIEGHTDNQGAADYNQRLSQQRAETVKLALAAGGMDPNAIASVGYGETDPIEDNSTEEGRAENRRVVVVVSPGDVIRY